MNSIRVAVIGTGNMGYAHSNHLYNGGTAGMQLAAICDIDPAKRQNCAEHFPGIQCFEDYHELLASGAADAVIVAVPHPLHSLIASEALRTGHHVLVEKPIDVSLSHAQALCETAKQTDRVFAIMLNQRTSPIFRKARQIVQSGQLGQLKRSVWIITNWYRTQHYYDSGTWRATWAGEGGGVLLNQAPHNLDLWQWICGMPESVTAFCDVAKYHRIEVEDDATIMARYPSGATGVFITTTGEYPGTNRLEISGEKGKLVLEDGKLKWWKLLVPENEFRFQSTESFAHIPMEYEEYIPEEKETAHAGILQNFANAILHGEPLISPGPDGLNELTISNAAYLSAWRGSVPVTLPLDTAAFDEALAALAETSSYNPDRKSDVPKGQYSNRWQVNW